MKKLLLTYIFMSLTFVVNAQKVVPTPIDPNKVLREMGELPSDASMNLLSEGVRPAFIISHQSFQVRDKKTGDLYGLNNHDEFGTEITLGIKVNGGYLLTDRAIRPWEYNSKFGTYKDNYDPVPYTSEISEIGDKAKYDSLDISKSKLKDIVPQTLYLVSTDNPDFKGLAVNNEAGKKDGWIVWATANKDSDLNKTASITLNCYSKTVEASKDGSIDVDAPKDQNVLGGIYVVPVVKGIGILEFQLAGVLTEKDSKWSICFPFIGRVTDDKAKAQDKAEVKEEEKPDSLTPVEDDVYGGKSTKKKSKKSKQNKK